MSNRLFYALFAAGLAFLFWMGANFIGSDPLAVTMILMIIVVYALGFVELKKYRLATDSLVRANAAASKTEGNLDAWIMQLDISLQLPVKQRIESGNSALPTPVLTPYLIGLLVMLGLIGTFAGMVGTLKGAVIALEGTTELEAIRAGLAAPMKGLGLAFGTSVAGVGGSAFLGLLSTLSRRERMQESNALNRVIVEHFNQFSLNHNRLASYKANQQQAELLPELMHQINGLAKNMELMGEKLSSNLIANQDAFHDNATKNYTDLARSVKESLAESLAQGGQTIVENTQPVLESTIKTLQAQLSATSERLVDDLIQASSKQLTDSAETFAERASSLTALISENLEKQDKNVETLIDSFNRVQLEHFNKQQETSTKQIEAHAESINALSAQLSESLNTTSAQLTNELESSLKKQILEIESINQSISQNNLRIDEQLKASFEASSDRLSALNDRATELIETRTASEEAWMQARQTQMQSLQQQLMSELSAIREQEAQRQETIQSQLLSLEKQAAEHLLALGQGLEVPMTRLIETASETPKAAADVISQLKQEVIENAQRENDLIEERATLMANMDALFKDMATGTSDQREAIAKLVDSSSQSLSNIEQRFSEGVASELSNLQDISAHFSASAAEIASLGDAFNAGVELYAKTNTDLSESLNKIEQSLNQSSTRNDEQLAYYIAQAREMIDYNLISQNELLEKIKTVSLALPKQQPEPSL